MEKKAATNGQKKMMRDRDEEAARCKKKTWAPSASRWERRPQSYIGGFPPRSSPPRPRPRPPPPNGIIPRGPRARPRPRAAWARRMADLPTPAPFVRSGFFSIGAFFSMSGRIMKRTLLPRINTLSNWETLEDMSRKNQRLSRMRKKYGRETDSQPINQTNTRNSLQSINQSINRSTVYYRIT